MRSEFGLVGNGRMLARVHADGSLAESFFPSIGFYRHILQSQFGLYVHRSGRAVWLANPEFSASQRYLDGTNVLETTFTRDHLRCVLTDFVHPEHDVLIRMLAVTNEGPEPEEVSIFHMEAASLEENKGNFGHNVAYFNHLRNCVVRYRGHPWDNGLEAHTVLLLAGEPPQDQIQCGVSYQRDGNAQDAFLDVSDGRLNHNTYSSGDAVGATSAHLWTRTLAPGETVRVSLLMAGASDLFAAEEILDAARRRAPEQLLQETVTFWQYWLATGLRSMPSLPEERLRQGYARSLLLLKLLQDARFGAFIAAPNLYPDYRYCWPRDGAYMAWAMDRCGYHAEARHFYRWCLRTQLAEGHWAQNYYPDGRRHWMGIQVDQVGTLLWGMLEHHRLSGAAPEAFLAEGWPAIQRAAEYILSRVTPELGLVFSEQDLWEETSGHLLYTNAACAAGLRAAAEAARLLDHPDEASAWSQSAQSLVLALRERLLQDGYYVGEYEPGRTFPVRQDYFLDISNLGAAIPFGVIPPADPAMRRTAERIEQAFDYPIGGVGRYASDLFVGGNPWPLSVLWLAMYYAACGEPGEARRHLEWTLGHATGHGFLPEQVDKQTGEPVSAHPLGWSHAWLIIVLQLLGGKAGDGRAAAMPSLARLSAEEPAD